MSKITINETPELDEELGCIDVVVLCFYVTLKHFELPCVRIVSFC